MAAVLTIVSIGGCAACQPTLSTRFPELVPHRVDDAAEILSDSVDPTGFLFTAGWTGGALVLGALALGGASYVDWRLLGAYGWDGGGFGDPTFYYVWAIYRLGLVVVGQVFAIGIVTAVLGVRAGLAAAMSSGIFLTLAATVLGTAAVAAGAIALSIWGTISITAMLLDPRRTQECFELGCGSALPAAPFIIPAIGGMFGAIGSSFLLLYLSPALVIGSPLFFGALYKFAPIDLLKLQKMRRFME